MNVVLEKHKYNQHLHGQQHAQQNLLKRQAALAETEGMTMGRNAPLANGNKKFVNHSLNFVDQQSGGSDFNYEAVLPSNEAGMFQQTQQIGKAQKAVKQRPTQFQLQ